VEPRKKLSDVVKDMAALKRQWADTRPAPDTSKPIPKGEYVCDLVDGAAFTAGTGTPGYKVTLRVKDGPFAGRLVWHDYYLSVKALPYTMLAFEKLGLTDLEQLDAGLPAGLVVRATVVVNTRNDGGERNEVRSWELVAVGAPAPTSTTPPAAPAASDAPAPWAVDLDALDPDSPTGGGE
jgi:hypothetical protein